MLIAPLTLVSVEAMSNGFFLMYGFREYAVTTAGIQSYGSVLSQMEGESK